MKDLAKIRNDVVGSLLRPARLKAARASFEEGKMGVNAFRAVEDEEPIAAHPGDFGGEKAGRRVARGEDKGLVG